MLWVAEGGGPVNIDYPTALAFDGDGNIYVGGLTQGSIVEGVANQGSFDIFAIKFSPGGKQLAAWQRNTSAFDQNHEHGRRPLRPRVRRRVHRGAIVPGAATAGREDMFVMKADLR